ncbi:hypothetical protein Tco_0750239 [Tanacetum coccineum]|uniref:Uncharacterized protein n=1 Tax=Tanacetum coccineum TaxID=301880 RepID=A0ABQ4Z0P6_9ASTR
MKGIYTRSRNSAGTLFLHCARTTEHGVLSYTLYFCQVSGEILGTQSREFRRTSSLCVVPVSLPEESPENLSGKSSGHPSGCLRRHVLPPLGMVMGIRLFYRVWSLGASEVFVLILIAVPRVAREKENGLQILQSIDQGPFELGTTRDALGTTPEGGVLLGPERPRTYEDLGKLKKRYDTDVRATNIVLQGIPKEIYKLINHNIEAKSI